MMSIKRDLQQTLMLQNHSNISSEGLVREGKLKTETGALIAAAQDHATLITLKRLFRDVKSSQFYEGVQKTERYSVKAENLFSSSIINLSQFLYGVRVIEDQITQLPKEEKSIRVSEFFRYRGFR